ncbi:MAG: c-type cytochrome [Blastocatellia bacterium]
MTKLRILIVCLFVAAAVVATMPHSHAQDPPTGGGRRGGNIREFLGLEKPPDPVAAERGAPLYAASCSFCHGPKARGAEGPNLIRSVIVLHDEDGNKLVPYLKTGNPEKGMPAFPRLTEAQAKDIAQFLHLQVELTANRGTYTRLNVVTGTAARGEAFFNGEGKCSTCHSITGDLAKIGGKFPPDVIQNRFLWPGGGGFGGPTRKRIATVTLPDGKTVKGTIKMLDDFNVSLYDEAGNYHSWSREHSKIKITVEDPLKAHRELLDKYTDEIMHDLTAYLVTIK